MNFPEIQLPSNRKFGFFFTAIFCVTAVYFILVNNFLIFFIFSSLGLSFLVATLLNANLLLPLNKLWMRFGLLLSKVISPIILGLIFFGIFVPVSLIIRLIGRDELNLKAKKKSSYWILRKISATKSYNFKYQF